MKSQTNLFDICEANHGNNPNSVEAHASIVDSKRGLQGQILAFLAWRGALGATCEEIEEQLGLSHQNASARCSELKKSGAVVVSGTRPARSGRSASVLVVA
jgi:hypothetical protein